MTAPNSRNLDAIQTRPFIYGIIAIGLSSKLAVEQSGKVLSWQQLQKEQVTVPATIISDRTRINASGTLIGHEITYELSAPGEDGSTQSAANIQAQLEDQFFNGETDLTINPEQPSSKLATVESFHRGNQLVKPKDYIDISLSNTDINIIYAQSDPSNSAIANTNSGPAIPPILITLLIFTTGCWFLWQSLKNNI